MMDDWYAQSVKKIEQFALVIGLAGGALALVNYGWRAALGFVCGAVISEVNFRAWKRLVAKVGEDGDAKSALMGMRYLVIGAAVFAIIKLLDVSALAVLAGLLVTVAAALAEITRQLLLGKSS